jgi:hypothetical protein
MPRITSGQPRKTYHREALRLAFQTLDKLFERPLAIYAGRVTSSAAPLP